MYTGGIADKFGNRYEAKLLIHKLLDVLLGELEWIRFEGIESSYEGFEFAVGKDGKTKWYQTKINAPHGNWTTRTLNEKGVLSAFAKRLDVDPNCDCHFISQDTAKDMRLFSSKARIANQFKEYEDSLTEDQTLKLSDIAEAWKTDNLTVFDRLKRSHFDAFPETEIDTTISTKANLIFSEWGENTFALLREYMEQNLNKPITTEYVREYLKQQNVGFKDWKLDPTLKEKLTKQTERYLNSYIPFGVGGTKINRQETKQLISEAENESGAQVIMLTGVAGSGKSGIIRAFIEHLKNTEINHLAFRIDHHLDCATPENIGLELIDRKESPVITLEGISQGCPSILIVDQVDAVSEVSGRKGAVKNAVLELLSGLNNLSTKIVLICRDFDLDSDSRFKTIENKEITKRIKIGVLVWKDEICPVLEEKGIDPNFFSDRQKELLALPLNLALFFEAGADRLEFENRNDLFEALLIKKESDIRDRQTKWNFTKPLSELALWMSDKQQLNAPAYILDKFPQSKEIFISEGLIVSTDKKINFFHESFFDYIYAHSFISSQKSIMELLLSTEQHLFRRTQVRQILEVLRQHDTDRYIAELDSLFKTNRFRSFLKKSINRLPSSLSSRQTLSNFKDSQIRYHIRIAIANWLGSIKDPKEKERQIGLSLDDSGKGFSRLAHTVLLGSPGWFDIQGSTTWLLDILNGDDKNKCHDVLLWLLRIAHERPRGVANVLRAWWDNNPDRAIHLLQNSFFVTTKDMGERIEPIEKLFCDLIDSEPEGLFSHKTASNRDYILNTWVNEHAKRGSIVLKSYLNCWFKAHSDDHPFSRDHFSELDMHALSEASEKSPAEFVSGFIDALNKSIDLIIIKKSNGEWDSTFDYIQAKDCYGSDEFVSLFRNALKKIAKSDPELASEHLSSLSIEKHKLFVHLHLETVASNPKYLKDNFIALLNSTELIKAGYSGIEWQSFAVAAREAFPYLDTAEKLRIERIIKTHKPEIARAVKRLKSSKETVEKEIAEQERKWALRSLQNSGYEQWCILETICEAHLSHSARMQYKQLGRKFSEESVAEPRGSKGGLVRSPILLENAKYMSDKQWLQAIAKYDSDDDKEWHDNYVIGGAEQLARVLSECTQQEPNRFSKLLLKIPVEANPSYHSNILFGLRQTSDCLLDNLASAIDHIEEYFRNTFGSEISHLISQYPQLCDDRKYLDLLIWYARNGMAKDDSVVSRKKKDTEEVTTIESIVNQIDGLHMSGTNGTRGAAILAVSRICWEFKYYLEEIEQFLEERVTQEPLTSVRCVVIDVLLPFYNYDRYKCGKLLLKLVERNPDQNKSNLILTSRQGINLLQYILVNVPEYGDKLLIRLINSKDKNTKLIGAWLTFGASYQNDYYKNHYRKIVNKGVEYKRLAAQVSADFFKEADFRDVAIKRLFCFFNDNDAHVRGNASRVFSRIRAEEFNQHTELIKKYLKSKAFSGNLFNFLKLLNETQFDVSEYVILSAENIFQKI